MTCTRCGGGLRCERVHWRSRHSMLACMACGDRIDDTILAHRRRMVQQDETHEWKRRLWERIRTITGQEVPA